MVAHSRAVEVNRPYQSLLTFLGFWMFFDQETTCAGERMASLIP
jgi:hypothetical protein